MPHRFRSERCTSLACLLLLVFAGRAAALDPSDSLDRYARQSWQTDGGLPQNTVSAILQTSDGYLWLGTDGGLARFDGHRFAVFDSQNGALPNDRIRGLAQDRAGALWVATADGLLRREGGRFRRFGTDDGLPGTDVLTLTVDSRRGLLVTTSRGAASFDGSQFRTISAAIDPTDTLSSGDVTWTPTTRGLIKSGRGFTQTYTVADGLPSNRITALHLDRAGTLWIGTESGLARLGPKGIEVFPSTDLLSSDAVLALQEDRDGDLWVGTDANGVTVLRDQKFVAYSGRAVGLDRTVRCVLSDHAGTIWAGTDGEGVVRVKDGAAEKPAWNSRLSSGIVLALADAPNGDLLVGTPDGLNILHGDRVSVLTSADGLAEDFIRSVYVDRDGSIWVGTRRGLSHLEAGRTKTYTQADGLGSDMVGSLLRDRDGNFWAGTLNGLSRLQNGAFTTFTVKNGLSSNTITDLHADREGVLWIGTQGGSVDLWRRGSFTALPKALGLPATIYGIAEDPHNDLWFAAKTGIFRVNRSDLFNPSVQGMAVPYGTGDGLRVRECSGGGHPAISETPAGDIWFAMERGLAELRAAHTFSSGLAPPVVIESITVDGKAFDPERIAQIDAGHSHLGFEYAGLSFAAPGKVCYRYRLDNFDRGWVDAGTQRVAYYTNLPPGRYRFQVKAENGDGLWNTAGAAFSFEVKPQFYQTWWFRSLILLALALTVYGGYYVRVRQVQAEYAAVLGERNRIAREIHDTLAQGFVGVSVQLELVSRFLANSPDAARAQLNETRTLVRNCIAEARQSIWELRSQSSENQDFAARLSNMAKQVAGTSGVRVQMAVRGTFRPLTTRLEDELFRIGQEAVTNAVRHGGAKHIDIELVFDAGKLRMTVADDGCGFEGSVNSSGPEGHFGLKGMRERATQIQAELRVDSALGKGTRVWLETAAK